MNLTYKAIVFCRNQHDTFAHANIELLGIYGPGQEDEFEKDLLLLEQVIEGELQVRVLQIKKNNEK